MAKPSEQKKQGFGIVKQVGIFVRRYAGQRFGWLIRYYVKLRMWLYKRNGRSFLVVLTFGKVASTSVFESVKSTSKQNVFHVHHLSRKGLDQARRFVLSSDRKSVPVHVLIAEELREILEADDRVVDIVTVVREPIGRRISSFFQNTDLYSQSVEDGKYRIDASKASDQIREILNKDNVLVAEERWLQSEIFEEFGIDVFAEEFDVAKGYRVSENKKCRLLLLRFEDLKRIFSSATEEFFGIPGGMALLTKNKAENKLYSDSYKTVKSNFKLERELLEKYTDTRYFQHFYRDMKSQVRDRWRVESSS